MKIKQKLHRAKAGGDSGDESDDDVGAVKRRKSRTSGRFGC
jgi:hypothetical protein